MKNFKKIWLASFLSIYLLAGLLLFIPNKSQAAEGGMFDITQNINFKPQVGIPDSEFFTEEPVAVGGTGINKKGETVVRSDLLAKYINAFYKWGLSIVAVIAVIVLMAGGLMWIVSGGESGTINKAKDMIFGSLTGMALLVGAWFFLNTINPKLTQLPAIEMVIINKTNMGCCEVAKDDGQPKMTMDSNCKSGFSLNKSLVAGKCEPEVCCVYRRSVIGTACFKSIGPNCSIEIAGVTGAAMDSKCEDISECKTITTCDDVKNGDKPTDSFGSENHLYCYNGRAYPSNFAHLQEPCGKKSDGSYGVCIKSTDHCIDYNQTGGRRCGSDTDFSIRCCLD